MHGLDGENFGVGEQLFGLLEVGDIALPHGAPSGLALPARESDVERRILLPAQQNASTGTAALQPDGFAYLLLHLFELLFLSCLYFEMIENSKNGSDSFSLML